MVIVLIVVVNLSGADDSYKLHVKIKDAQGNTLSTDDNYKT